MIFTDIFKKNTEFELDYKEERSPEFYKACNELDKSESYLKLYIDTQYKALVTKTLLSPEGINLEAARLMANFLKTIIPTVKKGAKAYREDLKSKGLL